MDWWGGGYKSPNCKLRVKLVPFLTRLSSLVVMVMGALLANLCHSKQGTSLVRYERLAGRWDLGNPTWGPTAPPPYHFQEGTSKKDSRLFRQLHNDKVGFYRYTSLSGVL